MAYSAEIASIAVCHLRTSAKQMIFSLLSQFYEYQPEELIIKPHCFICSHTDAICLATQHATQQRTQRVFFLTTEKIF